MQEYILDGKKVVKATDRKGWGSWMEHNSRHVADTLLYVVPHTNGPLADEKENEVRISTVFLGIDHAWNNESFDEPLIFETMIFGGEHDDHQRRCYTWEQAEAMHMEACKLVIFGRDEE